MKKSKEPVRTQLNTIKNPLTVQRGVGGGELETCREREIKEEGEEAGREKRRKEVSC